jgi:hypothetical protein
MIKQKKIAGSLIMNNAKIAKIFFPVGFIILSLFFVSCKTVPVVEPVDEYKAYLTPDPESDELFRVLIISDRYEAVQMKQEESITRADDQEGDMLISDKLRDYDKIDEICEGILTVWLYPDSGKLMKIRPKSLAPIAEINSLIVEDLKRWSFTFEGKTVDPNIFDVKYRVVLRKMQSDEDIMKEVMEKVKQKEGKKQISDD